MCTPERIRQAFAATIRASADPMDSLRRDLLPPSMLLPARVALLRQYGLDNFIRQWAERVERRRAAGHYRMTDRRTGESRDPTPEEAWQLYGEHYIVMFAGGATGNQEILSALGRYQMTRDQEDLARSSRDAARIRVERLSDWVQWWDNHYLSPQGRIRPEAELARWLLFRWDRLTALAQRLRTAGWYPEQSGLNYEHSYLVLTGSDQAQRDAGRVAGETYFSNVLGRYCTRLNELATTLVRYAYSYPTALQLSERTTFEQLCDAWGTLNGSPGNPPGLPHPSGLPYGHAGRITAIHRHKEASRTGSSVSDQLRQSAGIEIQTTGGRHIYASRLSPPCSGRREELVPRR